MIAKEYVTAAEHLCRAGRIVEDEFVVLVAVVLQRLADRPVRVVKVTKEDKPILPVLRFTVQDARGTVENWRAFSWEALQAVAVPSDQFVADALTASVAVKVDAPYPVYPKDEWPKGGGT